MRLGLIARCDESGLAVQTHAYWRHLNPHSTLVIDVGHLHNEGLHCNKRSFPERFLGATVVKGWAPDRPTLKAFLADIDVLLSAETMYGVDVPQLAHRYKVRTVLACNAEFLNRRDMPDLWVPPTRWMWDTIPDPKQLLPVPIDTDMFGVRSLPDIAQHFLHVAGRPAHLDRNGTADLLKALQHIKSEVTVTVRCQQAGYVSGLIREHNIRTPGNVTLRVESGSVEDNRDLYTEGDVLVLPRRFGGLCLPVSEALGVGLPCVMPEISPNTDWLPGEWLVPAVKRGSFAAKQRVDYYSVNPTDLAAKLDRFATDPDLYTKAKDEALRLRAEYSWDALKTRYEEVLGNV